MTTDIRRWYWLKSGDDTDLGWHDCIIGEWSLIVGGTKLQPVMRRHRGPWFAEFQPTMDRSTSVFRGPFKTAREAKRAAVEMAQDAIEKIAHAVSRLYP